MTAKLLHLASRWILIGAALIVVQVPGDAQDIDEVRRSAEQGDVSDQHELGRMYDIGEGVPRDYAEAAGWYRQAADQDHSRARLSLGSMYDTGEGVRQDYAEAIRWYRLPPSMGILVPR